MALTPAAKRKLGALADYADRILGEVIRERGGSAANVRHAGPWAWVTLGQAATAAVAGDASAEMAIKIAKQAKRLGENH